MTTQTSTNILAFLKANGQRSESEIAEALKMSLTRVRSHVAQLASSGDIICCNLTRFEGGKTIEGISCRLSCYTPPPARGRKPGASRSASSA
jgi:predicted transcriptional regulator